MTHNSLFPSPRAVLGRLLLAGTALGALALAAGDAQAKGSTDPYDRVIVFGDSISDSGTYADKAPDGAGKFTTNPDDVWVEVVAKGLGLDLDPHAAGGTNYAEGGARVALQRPDAPGDLTRRPITEQVADFLANDGDLGPDSLVIIQGGGNDVFATKFNGPADTPADLETLRVAAEGLADQVGLLIDAGAGTVVTTSVPKFDHYNAYYDSALASRNLNVLYVDMAGLIREIEADPAEFGIVNTTDRACKGSALESFVCLPENYVTPDANRTYLYADSVHFTGVVHEIEGDLTLAMLRAPGQFAQLAQVVRATSRADDGLARSQGAGDGRWRLIGGAKWSEADMPGFATSGEMHADATGFQFGGMGKLAPGLSAGLYLSWNQGNGSFAEQLGWFDYETLGLTAFTRFHSGPFDAELTASVGGADFDQIVRNIPLGPALRTEAGDTSGHYAAVEGRASMLVADGPLAVRPFVTLRYDRVKVNGYAEAGTRATQVTFGDQTLETLELGAGLRLAPRHDGRPVKPFVELGYSKDILGAGHSISILPSGAPVWFTSDPSQLSGGEFFYSIGANAPLGPRSGLSFRVEGREGKEGRSELAASVGLSMRF